MSKTWHLLAPEFPPGCGGVGDYTSLVASSLAAAGDRVHVWHPGTLPDRFGRGSRARIDAALAADPGIVLVQYVPAVFGLRGLNLPFCRWVARLAKRGLDVRVMFHEPFFYFGVHRPWRNGLAVMQRIMAATLLRAATRVYYSTETWSRLLAGYGPQTHAEVLPIPATIPTDPSPGDVAVLRASAGGALTIGHFGTYGAHVAGVLLRVVPELTRRLPEARLVLAGRGAADFAADLPAQIRARVHVVDADDGAAIAAALGACDILVQPYPDGVTTRRTSMMAALAAGVPVVTTRGELTETVWSETGAASLTPAGVPAALVERVVELAADARGRNEQGRRGRRVYDERFALDLTIARMRR